MPAKVQSEAPAPMESLLYEVKKVIVGQDHLLERMAVALRARGYHAAMKTIVAAIDFSPVSTLVCTTALELARSMGLKGGVVTNAYWATTAEDAKLYLRLLKDGLTPVMVETSDVALIIRMTSLP